MSASLVRRGLELLSNDIKSDNKAKKKKKQRQSVTPNLAAAKALVSTNRQGVTRQVKRLQGRLGPGKSKATVKDKRIKCALDEFREQKKKNQMEANLKYFLRTEAKATISDTLKIQNHNVGRQSRHRRDHPNAKKPKEKKSVFTEEEFQQFQKEYFGRTVEEKKFPLKKH
ncbi:ribosomal protein S19 binding protein 1 [Syngnathoides biaculeatus]|uniref:ribosomal protein S19 binding protein 1 n=1 Tax=Syngnathoides biaculeatus TaxID=300417 RepID=UPI002ADDAD9D|nr:ribosomal protein S19 binding protein 1 [Syngnathoides biaculeatus]